jgi:hypothetical protein
VVAKKAASGRRQLELEHRPRAQHILQRLAQPLTAVDHAQHPSVEAQPAGYQVLEVLGADRGILPRAETAGLGLSGA